MQAELLKKMFEYNLAANTRMIELCMGLTDEQLAVEAEGVYGRIQPLLVHTVRAEGGYLGRLTGKRPFRWCVEYSKACVRCESMRCPYSIQNLL